MSEGLHRGRGRPRGPRTLPGHLRDEVSRRCMAVRAERARHGLTQAQMNVWSGVSQPTISSIETGWCEPHLSVYLRCVEGLRRASIGGPPVSEREAVALRHDRVRAVVQARRRCGLTQGQVEERSGVTQSAISRFERHLTDPYLSTYLLIAWAVDLDE